MSTCPCCSSPLLRHIRGREVYWFCRHCWQAMPVLSAEKITLSSLESELTRMLQKPEKEYVATRKIQSCTTFAATDLN